MGASLPENRAADSPGGAEGLLAARYSIGAIWLHWIIAALLLFNWGCGYWHESFGRPAAAWLMFFHKSIGMTVLVLTFVRLAWRLGHRPPPFDPVMKKWEAGLARLTHWLFYILLVLIPLTGWMFSSTSTKQLPINYFGLFDIGLLPVPRDHNTHEFLKEVHEILAKVMLGLIVLHVAGALKQHLEGHRHLIGRMAPWLYRRA